MYRSLFLIVALMIATAHGHQPDKKIVFQPLVRDVKEIDLAEQELPRNYRTTHDNINIHSQEEQPPIRLEGLKELFMGGSAQFTEAQLKEILSHWNTKVIIVDLREETHLILETREGKQIPISAFVPLNIGNVGKSRHQIDYEHLRYRDHILEQGVVALPYGKGDGVVEEDAPVFEVSNVYTEKELVEKINQLHPHGVEYVYLPVTDHLKPTPEAVDTFLEVMQKVQNDNEANLLFHCRAGRGRTGMMMVMRDMLENAKKYNLSFDQILKRQELLGSPDFSDVSEGKEEQSIERYEFLKHFYQFILAQDGFETKISYTTWLKIHPVEEMKMAE